MNYERLLQNEIATIVLKAQLRNRQITQFR
jgi:hypothetical protein